MKKLSLVISKAVQEGKWHPVRVGKESPSFSHIFFADDVFLFSNAMCGQGKLVVELFERFSSHCSLRVNVSKSRAFFSKGVRRWKMEKITSISSICSTQSSEKYIGFPIYKGRVKKEDFGFIDKMQQRLSSWKNKLLNKVGRITNVKSVITYILILTYYMQHNWIPTSECTQMD